ncbi:RUND1-like protein [Mya arenaria]|uniref:RUND1-like protein n=1 Tax=Mya arenaria TaxID=6604 RepID=A0ABY7DWB2_MYAAR|nr:RUND1-like protein [Mya arenaria]
MATTSEDNYDSHDDPDYDSDRPTERWAPLGAVSDIEPTTSHSEISRHSEREELERLEEEQEQLNSSLLALTTHFAQVQFRLKQIVSSDDDQKERLLKELEEFAFRGIPDVRGCTSQDAQILEEMSDREHEVKLTEQREKQRELITQLKSQLENLETYAYETGDIEELPTSRQMEKQKFTFDEQTVSKDRKDPSITKDSHRHAEMLKKTLHMMQVDLRARLELAVDKVSTAARYQPTQDDESGDYNSESEESQEMSSPLLTQTHGQEYNQSPARKLSQSFHLEIVGGKAITSKQTLLGAINTVLTTHTHLKRSEDSHFKAEGKLPQWMKLIFRTQTLVDNYYQDWSYVARTGFDDAIKSLDKLSQYKFNLPVDLAIRPFSNIKDAF